MADTAKKWSIIGPGGGGGQFYPTISPHDPKIALMACDMTAAYITHDGGKKWRLFHLKTCVRAFEFDPKDPDVIYAGSNALYRSSDRGETWRPVLPAADCIIDERKIGDHSSSEYISTDCWEGGSVQAITVDDEDTSKIYTAAGSRNGIAVYATNGQGSKKIFSNETDRTVHCIYIDSLCPERGLYVFTDKAIYRMSADGGRVSMIAMPEGIKKINHACCGLSGDGAGNVMYITTESAWDGDILLSGVWKSSDCGSTWQRLDVMASENSGRVTALLKAVPSYYLITTSRYNASTVYVSLGGLNIRDPESGAGSVINTYGICKSSDEGAHWSWVIQGDQFCDPQNRKNGWVEINYTPAWTGTGPKGSTAIGLKLCETNPDICMYTDIGASFATVDGGKTWEQLYSDHHDDGTVSSRGVDVTTCFGVHFNPFDKEHIVISYTDLGMFDSKNGGKTWRHTLNGITPAWGNTCYWMVFDPEVRGKAWGVWSYAHDLPRPKMFRNGWFRRATGGVSRTLDACDTWMPSSSGMPENSVACHIIMDPRSPVNSRVLYTAVFDKGVYKSTDDGCTWQLKNNGLAGNGNLNAFRLCLLPDGVLYLVVSRGLAGNEDIETIDGALYKSSDGAETWQRVALPKGLNCPNDIIYDPADPNRLFLACWPRTEEGREYFGGVYVSHDAGATWENTFDETAHVYGIVADEFHPGRLYINTFDHSAYRSDDSGKTWMRLGGYNFHWGQRPVVDVHNPDMLYLTTFGGSVWHGPADGVPGAVEDIVF